MFSFTKPVQKVRGRDPQEPADAFDLFTFNKNATFPIAALATHPAFKCFHDSCSPAQRQFSPQITEINKDKTLLAYYLEEAEIPSTITSLNSFRQKDILSLCALWALREIKRLNLARWR